jgi:hypothetical protein
MLQLYVLQGKSVLDGEETRFRSSLILICSIWSFKDLGIELPLKQCLGQGELVWTHWENEMNPIQ